MIGIICDTGSDITERVRSDDRVEVVPLKVILDEREHNDSENGLSEKVIAYQKDYQAKTSLPALEEVKSAFYRLIDRGYDEIVGMNISSNLSGTHNVFKLAAKEILTERPNLKIRLFDSLSISIGTGLLILKTLQFVTDGLSFEEVGEKVAGMIPKKSKVMFIIPTLKHLKEGGRIGKVSATIGELLKIKPVICVGDDGIYYTLAKAQGMKNAVRKIIEEFQRDFASEKVETAALYHSGDPQGISDLLSSVVDVLKRSKVPYIEGQIAPSLVVHTGEHLVGLAYLMV
ncbi:MAG TPA: DegV family protein [Thermotogota bacterium]|nr:DegV family protein [Thermotogota bacterium]HNR62989.1 DegV family protein [Thermotogota bacterium]HQC36854.1 DegV family protein [Thermotogota bacterium]HQN21042.1 DegV family protein [Thermotogota bacterium]HQQ66122.1 DegV family protein [Thermotogota bacterium]